jgi:hypothetical protein
MLIKAVAIKQQKRKICYFFLSRNLIKNKWPRAGDMVQVVKHLPRSKWEILI